MQYPEMKNLPGLTVIRFFAAAWVYCFHTWLWIGKSGLIANISSVGYAGVSIFFVLSGFILSYNYLGTEFTAKQFWIARAARILPVYWLALILDIPSLIHGAMIGRPITPARLLPAPVLLQSWFPAAAMVWNTPAWSVSTEAFFYLIFPFATPWIISLFRKHPAPVLLALWILSTAPTLFYALFQPEGLAAHDSRYFWLDVIKLNPIVRCPEFLFGVCVGAGFRDGWRIPKPRIGTLLTIVGICLAIELFHDAPYPAFHNGLLAPLFALLILAVASSGDWLNWRPLVQLGEASYSLYLLSYPVALYYTAASLHLPWLLPSRSGLAGIGCYFAISLVSSLIVYSYFEKPCRHKLRALLSREKPARANVAS